MKQMNKKLVKQLSEKWGKPSTRPAKGAALVDKCAPCAQSDAVMVHQNISTDELFHLVQDKWADMVNTNYLDNLAAKSLGISTTHSILLRRFNDYSTEDPITVIINPEKILGPNYKKVLAFWFFIDSLSAKDWASVNSKVSSYTYNYNKKVEPHKNKQWNAKKKFVKSLLSNLEVISPDLYYGGDLGCESKPKKISEASEEDQHKVRSSVELYVPRAGFFGWISAWDYGISNSDFDWHKSIPYALAYATSEIQCSGSMAGHDKWFFCKMFNYNPDFALNPLTLRVKRFLNKTVKKTYAAEATFQYIDNPVPLNSIPILTLSEIEKVNISSEIVFFIKSANIEGRNSVILALPKVKEDFVKVLLDRVRAGLEVGGVKVEDIGDSLIRSSPDSEGLTCWRLSWTCDKLNLSSLRNFIMPEISQPN